MEDSSVVMCSRCKLKCARGQDTDRTVKKEEQLWEYIPGTENAIQGTCPGCDQAIVQCRHCSFYLCKNDKETKKKCSETRHSIVRMIQDHIKSEHEQKIPSKKKTGYKRKLQVTGEQELPLTNKDGNGDQDKAIAKVVCPSPSCGAKIIQCCHCSYIIDPNNPQTKLFLGRRRRSAEGMLEQHMRQYHPDVPMEEYDDIYSDSMCADVTWDEHDDDTHVPPVEHQESIVNNVLINDQIDGSQHSFDSSSSRRADSSLEFGRDLCGVFDSSTEEEEEGEFEEEEEQYDHEAEIAQKYVDLFNHLSLDPNKEGGEEEDDTPTPASFPDAGTNGSLKYEDFDMFDNRLEEDKTFKDSSRKRLCQNQLYFYQSYMSDGGGFRGLVGRSNKRNREDSSASVPLDEAAVVFLMFILVMGMTMEQQSLLARYNKKLLKLLKIEEIENTTSTRFPTNMDEMRCQVTIGVHSILKNFPAPRVYEICLHAVVGLKESILLLLGHGIKPNFGMDNGERNVEGLNGTKAMYDLIKEVAKRMKDSGIHDEMRKKTKIGYLIFWSDSFLRCFIKQKENSVWILTVTVCPPENKKSSGNYTIILAIGKSGEDHTEVVERFMQEADELMKGFDCYFGSTRTMERVAFGVLAWCADRPEMQSLTHTMKEGNYGKVSGWSVKPSEEFLPACAQCYKALIRRMLGGDYIEPNHTCNSCCNWSFETKPVRTEEGGHAVNLQEADTGPAKFPRSYPDSRHNGTSVPPMPEGRRVTQAKHLPPVRLSKEWMQQAVTSGYFGVRVGKWGKGVAEGYFQSCNIKAVTYNRVIDTAKADRERNIIDPSSVQPKFWNLVECFGPKSKFPVLPMHGIAHGMVPDVLDIILKIFVKYKKRQKFYEYANPIIRQVELLGLDYCKVKKLPKSAWVSENSIGFMRLMPYLIGTFLMNNPLGTSKEADEITSYIKCMVNAFHAYVLVLMSDTPVAGNILNSHIKLFMSSAHFLHKKHGKLDGSKNSVSGPPGQGAANRRYLEKQDLDVLQVIAHELGVPMTGGKEKVISNIRKPNKGVIQRALEMSDQDAKTVTKEGMYEILYNRMLEEQERQYEGEVGDNNVGTDSGVKKIKAKSEKMCWNSGYFLSFMANIVEQIEYMGVLRLIW